MLDFQGVEFPPRDEEPLPPVFVNTSQPTQPAAVDRQLGTERMVRVQEMAMTGYLDTANLHPPPGAMIADAV